MAQWLSQFTGNTHATKAEDAENQLRQAVASLRASSSTEERKRKACSVRNLAERLLSARVKLLKARIAALQPVADDKQPPGSGIDALIEREAKLRDEGLNGILVELGVQNVVAKGSKANPPL